MSVSSPSGWFVSKVYVMLKCVFIANLCLSVFCLYNRAAQRILLSDRLYMETPSWAGQSKCVCVCVCTSLIAAYNYMTGPHLYAPHLVGLLIHVLEHLRHGYLWCVYLHVCVYVCSVDCLCECVCREGECADCSALVLGMPIRSGYKS